MGAARKEWHLYHVWDAFRCKSISGRVRLLANSFPIKSSQSGLTVSTTGCSLDLKNIYMEWKAPGAEEIWEFWIALLRLLLDYGLFGSLEVPVKYPDFAVWKPQEQQWFKDFTLFLCIFFPAAFSGCLFSGADVGVWDMPWNRLSTGLG